MIATHRTPSLAPGFKATETETNEVLELSRELFKETGARAHFVADENQLGNALITALTPDVALTPAEPDIGFVHRRTSDAEVYFLANTSNVLKNVKATFRQQGLRAEWWDPFNGSVTAAKIHATTEKGITISLDLEPYASRVLVFTRRTLPSAQTTSSSTSKQIEIDKDWRVSFGPKGPSVLMNTLRSWTDDEETHYFSGVATYEKEVTVSGAMFEKGPKIVLDFGEGQANQSQPSQAGMQAMYDAPVREAAIVYVNGQRAGSIWCPPYSLDVTSLLRPGPNKLRIEVSNTAINYMSGRSLPDYRLLNLRFGERFRMQEMEKVQPVPSGMLGPIRLIWR